MSVGFCSTAFCAGSVNFIVSGRYVTGLQQGLASYNGQFCVFVREAQLQLVYITTQLEVLTISEQFTAEDVCCISNFRLNTCQDAILVLTDEKQLFGFTINQYNYCFEQIFCIGDLDCQMLTASKHAQFFALASYSESVQVYKVIEDDGWKAEKYCMEQLAGKSIIGLCFLETATSSESGLEYLVVLSYSVECCNYSDVQILQFVDDKKQMETLYQLKINHLQIGFPSAIDCLPIMPYGMIVFCENCLIVLNWQGLLAQKQNELTEIQVKELPVKNQIAKDFLDPIVCIIDLGITTPEKPNNDYWTQELISVKHQVIDGGQQIQSWKVKRTSFYLLRNENSICRCPCWCWDNNDYFDTYQSSNLGDFQYSQKQIIDSSKATLLVSLKTGKIAEIEFNGEGAQKLTATLRQRSLSEEKGGLVTFASLPNLNQDLVASHDDLRMQEDTAQSQFKNLYIFSFENQTEIGDLCDSMWKQQCLGAVRHAILVRQNNATAAAADDDDRQGIDQFFAQGSLKADDSKLVQLRLCGGLRDSLKGLDLWCGASTIWSCPLQASPKHQQQSLPFLIVLSSIQETRALLFQQLNHLTKQTIRDVSGEINLQTSCSSVYCSGMQPMAGQWMLLQVTPNMLNLYCLDALTQQLDSSFGFQPKNNPPSEEFQVTPEVAQALKKNRRSKEQQPPPTAQQQHENNMQVDGEEETRGQGLGQGQGKREVSEGEVSSCGMECSKECWCCPQGSVISSASSCEDLVLCSFGRQNLILWIQVKHNAPSATWKNLFSLGLQSKRKRAPWYFSKRGDRRMSSEVIACDVCKEFSSSDTTTWLAILATHNHQIILARLSCNGGYEELSCLDYIDAGPQYLKAGYEIHIDNGFLQDMWSWKLDGFVSTLNFVNTSTAANSLHILAGFRTGQAAHLCFSQSPSSSASASKLIVQDVRHLSIAPIQTMKFCQDPKTIYFILLSPKIGYLAKFNIAASYFTFLPLQDSSLVTAVPIPFSNINYFTNISSSSNNNFLEKTYSSRSSCDNLQEKAYSRKSSSLKFGSSSLQDKPYVGRSGNSKSSKRNFKDSGQQSLETQEGIVQSWDECKGCGKMAAVDSDGFLRLFDVELYRNYKFIRDYELDVGTQIMKLIYDPCFNLILAVACVAETQPTRLFTVDIGSRFNSQNQCLQELSRSRNFYVEDMCLWKGARKYVDSMSTCEECSYYLIALSKLPEKQWDMVDDMADVKGKLVLLRASSSPSPEYELQPQSYKENNLEFSYVMGKLFAQGVSCVQPLDNDMILIGVGGRMVLTQFVVDDGRPPTLDKIHSVFTEMAIQTPLIKACPADFDNSIFFAVIKNSASMLMRTDECCSGGLSARGLKAIAVDCGVNQVSEVHILQWSPHLEILIANKNGSVKILGLKDLVQSPEIGLEVLAAVKFVGKPVGCAAFADLPQNPNVKIQPFKNYCIWIPSVGGSVRLFTTPGPIEIDLLNQVYQIANQISCTNTYRHMQHALSNGDELHKILQCTVDDIVSEELKNKFQMFFDERDVGIEVGPQIYRAIVLHAIHACSLMLGTGENIFVHRLIHSYYKQ